MIHGNYPLEQTHIKSGRHPDFKRAEKMTKEYGQVVLDGANIIHDDTGIEKKDNEGNQITQIVPERLEAAISHCEGLGWPTIAFLKTGTYLWAKDLADSKSPYMGDLDILERLIRDRKVILISVKKEDIYWIDFALKENAIIVTHDKFKEEQDKYPKKDWKDIEDRTLRGHQFIKDKFILPGLMKKKSIQETTPDFVSFSKFEQLREEVEELQQLVREHMPKSQTNLEILQAVTNQALSNGKKVEIGHFHRIVASDILGLDLSTYPKSWPKGWPAKLDEKLGFEGKFYEELEKQSSKKICVASKKGKKGTKEVFYC